MENKTTALVGYTREQVEQMPAGREMDALIHFDVLGRQRPPATWRANIPDYSTDIAAAKQIQAKLLETGWDISIHCCRTDTGQHVTLFISRRDRELNKHCSHVESADNESLATARIGLLAAKSEAEYAAGAPIKEGRASHE